MKNEQKKERYEMYIKLDRFKTPEFQRSFRGYDRGEVDRYLSALVDAYNKMYGEHQEVLTELSEYNQKANAISEALIEAKAAAERIIAEARDGSSKAIPATMTEASYTDEKSNEPIMSAPNSDFPLSDLDIDNILKRFSSGRG